MKLAIRWMHKTFDALPSAREVRDILKWIDIGTHQVHYHNNDGQERFPWLVLGADRGDEPREVLGEFPRFREAVAFARKAQQ